MISLSAKSELTREALQELQAFYLFETGFPAVFCGWEADCRIPVWVGQGLVYPEPVEGCLAVFLRQGMAPPPLPMPPIHLDRRAPWLVQSEAEGHLPRGARALIRPVAGACLPLARLGRAGRPPGSAQMSQQQQSAHYPTRMEDRLWKTVQSVAGSGRGWHPRRYPCRPFT